MNDTQMKEMGEKGLELVKAKYTWDAISTELTNVYNWCIDKNSPVPKSVRFS